MLKCGSPLLVVKQAVVYNFPQTLVALAGHFEGLLVVANHACYLCNRPAFEGDVECQHLPEDHSEGIHVCGRGVLLASQNLWRHPVRCSNLSVVVRIKLLLVPGQTEIT